MWVKTWTLTYAFNRQSMRMHCIGKFCKLFDFLLIMSLTAREKLEWIACAGLNVRILNVITCPSMPLSSREKLLCTDMSLTSSEKFHLMTCPWLPVRSLCVMMCPWLPVKSLYVMACSWLPVRSFYVMTWLKKKKRLLTGLGKMTKTTGQIRQLTWILLLRMAHISSW